MKTLSDEHRRKISEAMKNRVLTVEHRKNISEAKFCSKFSEEHRENFIKSRTGKKHMKSRSVVLAFGRLNPPTIGHEKLVNKIISVAKTNKAEAHLYVTHTQDPKKNPLGYDKKINYLKKSFGTIVKRTEDRTLMHVLKTMDGKYDNVYIIAGSDRVEEFSKLVKSYNGKDYTFPVLEVLSAGERDENGDDAVSAMSASKLRKLAAEGDFNTFKTGLPVKLQKYAEEVYVEIRKKMNISK